MRWRAAAPVRGPALRRLALTSRGLRVVEFNVRFGDPETQVVLELLDTPLGQLLAAAAAGDLGRAAELRWRDESAVVVVVAAAGYPGSPTTGDVIVGAGRGGRRSRCGRAARRDEGR